MESVGYYKRFYRGCERDPVKKIGLELMALLGDTAVSFVVVCGRGGIGLELDYFLCVFTRHDDDVVVFAVFVLTNWCFIERT